MFAAFSVFAGIVYWYYQDTQEAMRVYAANQAKLEQSLETQIQATQALQRDLRVMNETLVTLNDEFAASRKRVNELEEILTSGTDGRQISVGERAVEDPAFIEGEINTGTIEMFNCFELLSGQEGEVTDDPKYISCINNSNSSNRLQ